jgi:hypothetical protein
MRNALSARAYELKASGAAKFEGRVFFPTPWHAQSYAGRQTTESAKSLPQELPKNVRNRWVTFRICDAYIPEPAQILMELHGKDQLEGKVIDVSDAGSLEEAFAVIEVQTLSKPVVVPVKHIREKTS